jgi:hypothetical protein
MRPSPRLRDRAGARAAVVCPFWLLKMLEYTEFGGEIPSPFYGEGQYAGGPFTSPGGLPPGGSVGGRRLVPHGLLRDLFCHVK